MVKHIILWKLKEEFSEEEKKQIKAGIKEGLEGLAGQIPGMTDQSAHRLSAEFNRGCHARFHI